MIIGNDFEAIMYIRNYQKNDLKSIIFLFRETVHSINSKDYTQEQVKIWAPENIDEKSWHLSLLSHYTLVAIDKEKIVGFVDLDENYVDRLYIAKDYQRQKIATRLMDKIENHAKITNGVKDNLNKIAEKCGDKIEITIFEKALSTISITFSPALPFLKV